MELATFVVVLWSIASCGGTGPEPVVPDTVAETGAEAVSDYRAGNYVLYRYEGSALEQPVDLREEVLEQKGLRLTIEVTATRGEESRQWIQVVTDTAENRSNNVIDELYEVVDGERRRLPNVDNEDAFRLYGWTLPPMCSGPADSKPTEVREVSITGEKHDCSCERAEQMCDDRSTNFEICDCESFLWTHAEGTITDAETNQVLWSIRVVEHGRDLPGGGTKSEK